MRYLLACLVLVGLCVPLQAIERNVASQKLELMVIDRTTGGPKTGDAANLTAYVSIDGDTTPDALTDTIATELSSTNAPGVYVFDLTQAETNGKSIAYTGKSSTANTDVIPAFVTTVPPNFGIVVIGADGLPTVNVGEWLDTDAATPTTAGVPEVDVTHWLGTAPATPTTAGVPEVDITHWLGTLLTTQPMTASDVQDEAEDGSALAIATYFGTAGSGLTGIPWNAAWDAEVQSEATDAISANFALAGGVVQANTVQISGDGPAADNAEAMFDGTGYAGGTIKLGTNVTQWTGTNVASPDTAGYPKVTIKSGTGTGELNITSGLLAWNSAWDAEVESESVDAISSLIQSAGGVVQANMVQISNDPGAADNAELMFDGTGYAGGTIPLEVSVPGAMDAADFRDALGMASANMDAQLGAIVTDTGETQTKLPSGGQSIAGASDLATVSTRVTTALPNAAPGADAGLPTTADVEAGGGPATVTEADAEMIAAKVVASRGDYYPPRALVWVLQRDDTSGIVVRDDFVQSKQAGETAKRYIDFAPLLGRNEAVESIDSLTITGSTFAITADSDGLTGNLAYMTITGGAAGATGTISFEVTTTADQVLTGEVQISVPE